MFNPSSKLTDDLPQFPDLYETWNNVTGSLGHTLNFSVFRHNWDGIGTDESNFFFIYFILD